MSEPIILPERHGVLIRRGWAVIALICVLDAVWMVAAGIGITRGMALLVAGAGLLLAAVALVYRRFRRDDAIWLAAQVMNQLVIGSCALATLSYIGLRLNFPLMDAQFAAVDRMLHFDWLAYIGWVESHPFIARIFTYSYAATEPQMLALFALLCFTKRFTAFHRLAIGYLLGGLITIVIADVWPALTAYLFFKVDPAVYPHLQIAGATVYGQDFFAMRTHQMTVLPKDFQGMVTFPSYHSVLAVISIFAALALRFRWLAALFIVLNLLTLLSTPVDGGHYLVDTLGGIIIGLLVAGAAARWLPENKVVANE